MNTPEQQLTRLIALMAMLRSANGCPWDRRQTHGSLVPYLIEEAYEVVDAIERGLDPALCEELADVALQLVFHAQIAAERNAFTLEDVLRACAEKLVRRHPHVFQPDQQPSARPLSADDVSARWDELKRREQPPRESAVAGVPVVLPALSRAQKVQSRAAQVGFDWPDHAGILDKLDEEVTELRDALGAEPDRVADELGDVLFTVVNLARARGIDAETALRGSTARFIARFERMERMASRSLETLSPAEWDALWRAAKASERAPDSDGG